MHHDGRMFLRYEHDPGPAGPAFVGALIGENRDKLQIIKERAKQGKFDILLVFMFDRIGRIADETPFVVEWFVKNGIRVWSTQGFGVAPRRYSAAK